MVNYLHHSQNPRGEKEIKGTVIPRVELKAPASPARLCGFSLVRNSLQGLQILLCPPDSDITCCRMLPALSRGRSKAHTCLTMGRKKR